jgi:hypothetical protein
VQDAVSFGHFSSFRGGGFAKLGYYRLKPNTVQIRAEAFKPWPVILNPSLRSRVNSVKNLNVGNWRFFALLRMT